MIIIPRRFYFCFSYTEDSEQLTVFHITRENGINVSLPSNGTSLKQTESDLSNGGVVTRPWGLNLEKGMGVGMEIIHTSS